MKHQNTSGVSSLKAAHTSHQIFKLAGELQRTPDKFKRAEINRELSWQRRRLIFFQGGRAK